MAGTNFCTLTVTVLFLVFGSCLSARNKVKRFQEKIDANQDLISAQNMQIQLLISKVNMQTTMLEEQQASINLLIDQIELLSEALVVDLPDGLSQLTQNNLGQSFSRFFKDEFVSADISQDGDNNINANAVQTGGIFLQDLDFKAKGNIDIPIRINANNVASVTAGGDFQCKLNEETCTEDEGCCSGNCSGFWCKCVELHNSCKENEQCCTGNCEDNWCKCIKNHNDCKRNEDCCSENCKDNVCRPQSS